MATLTTVNGVNATKRAASPQVALPVNENYGRVRAMYDEYTVDTADEFGTSGLINMMKIPKGAKLIGARTVCPATGATGIYDVGWAAGANAVEAADPDGIFVGQDPGAAAVDATMAGTVAGFCKSFSEEVQVQVDWTEVTADMGTKTLKLLLLIVVD